MQTHIHMHVCTFIHRQEISATMPQRVKKYNRCTYASKYICMHIHIDMQIHICAPLQRGCRRCVRFTHHTKIECSIMQHITK